MTRPLLLTLALLVGCTGTSDKPDDTGDTGDTGTPAVNTPPTAPFVRITPEDATSIDDLVVVIDTPATDADGDDVTYLYAWSRDGVLEADLTTDTVPADRLSRGEVWEVTVTPTDGVDEGAPDTDNIVIGNGPAAVTVAIEPTTLDTTSVAVAVATGMDPDGDALVYTYAWYVNDVLVGDATDTLDGALWFDRGDVVVAEVTAADPGGTVTVERSEGIVVGNLPPDAPTVAIDPAAPSPGASFTCAVSGTDPDADALTYAIAWTVDGVDYPGASTTTHPGDTIPAGVGVVGEVWTCTVVPSDDLESGPSASASATITDWTGPRSFTTCGGVGQSGPTQEACDAAYVGGTLEGAVTVDGGIQWWEAPVSGDFRITACGAQGASGTTTYVGGKGACVEGTFSLDAGDMLLVAVGQMGVGQGSYSNGGGGGGTFVVGADDVPLIIAGGGGGTRTDAEQNGCDGLATEYGVTGSGDSPTHTCDALTEGLGEGAIASSYSWGSGGAGFESDGGADTPFGVGGLSWWNGLTGGDDGGYACGENAYGGFGGGGSGNGCYGGGGGGGYSGGQGGWIAGGAGSYNAGLDAAGTDGANEGDGWVTIDLAR